MMFSNFKRSNNMSTKSIFKLCILLISSTLVSCSTFQPPKENITKEYVPDNTPFIELRVRPVGKLVEE